MESAVKFVLLPDGAHTSVHALAAMIADNLDRLLRVWRFSAPERDNLTLYTYAAAFRRCKAVQGFMERWRREWEAQSNLYVCLTGHIPVSMLWR